MINNKIDISSLVYLVLVILLTIFLINFNECKFTKSPEQMPGASCFVGIIDIKYGRGKI